MHIARMAMLTAGLISATSAALAAGQAKPAYQGRAPQDVYRVTCGYCHGHNVGPLILGRKLPAATIQAMVRAGRGAMPAFRPTEITHAELAALGQWIEKSKPNAKEHGQ